MTNFHNIQFTPRYHTYHLDGKRLEAVTRFLRQFKEPFDRNYWSLQKAKERGITQLEILAEWDAKGQASREKGTAVHNYIRDVLLLGKDEDDDPFLALNQRPAECDTFDSFWNSALGQVVDIYKVEWIIGDKDLGLAGTVDTVFYRTDTKTYHVFDWKTNEKFSVSSPYGKSLLPPFDDLEECDANYYGLQVSAYKLILERNTDLTMGDSYIVHLRPGVYHVHKAADFSERILRHLEGDNE